MRKTVWLRFGSRCHKWGQNGPTRCNLRSTKNLDNICSFWSVVVTVCASPKSGFESRPGHAKYRNRDASHASFTDRCSEVVDRSSLRKDVEHEKNYVRGSAKEIAQKTDLRVPSEKSELVLDGIQAPFVGHTPELVRTTISES
jgi:hypothetical protein